MPSCCSQRVAPVIKTILVWCVLAFAGVAQGGTFQVNPIRITLSPQSASALLSIQNDSAETARFQIDVFEWDQAADGEMVLNPTEDLIFYPKLLGHRSRRPEKHSCGHQTTSGRDREILSHLCRRVAARRQWKAEGNPLAHENGHSRFHSTYQAIGSTPRSDK